MIHAEIAKRLSIEQCSPFNNEKKHTCILAAAGSGKTRVLSYMIANDILNGIKPSQIVAFTFTEKAASELFTRVFNVVSELSPDTDIAEIKISTIHAWCMDYILNDPKYYGFVGMDELQQSTMITRLYDYLEIGSSYQKNFPKGVEEFIADVDILYNEYLSIADVPIDKRSSIGRYLEFLQKNRLMDFGYMIRSAVELLGEKGPVDSLKRLYIDEYQDVNLSQVLLAKRMLSDETRVCVVGDDLQCIYNWRGSDVKNIIDFARQFPDSSTYTLTSNYRSQKSIVNAANTVSGLISVKAQKPPMRAVNEDETKYIGNFSGSDEEEEAQFIADLVKSFVSAGYEFKEIAVLLRSVRGSGQPILEAFEKEGVPTVCTVINRGLFFINSFLIPLFRFILNDVEPKNEQEEDELERQSNSLFANACDYSSSKLKEEIFWQQVEKWRLLIKEGNSDAYNVRDCLYNLMNATDILLPETDIDLISGVGIASQIIRSVEETHRRRLDFQPRRPAKAVLNEIIIGLERWQEDFGESAPLTTWKDGVQVSTVHQSKGLEWPVVILPAMQKNRFPIVLRPARTVYGGEVNHKYGTKIDDERRLFYVAITRAKNQLVLTDSVRGELDRSSSFIRELVGHFKQLGEIEEIEASYFLKEHVSINDDNHTIKIGLSDLLILVECAFQFGLRRRAGIQPAVGDELGYGKGLHELIQRRIESNKLWTEDEIDKQVEQFVFLPLMSQEHENKSKEAIKKRIQEIQELEIFDREYVSEVDIQLKLSGAIVSGVIDGILSNDDGTVSIVDWKSNVHEEFISRYSRQMRFYAFALIQKGYKVKEAYLIDVAKSGKFKNIVKHNIDLSKEHIDGVLAEIDNAIRLLKSESFDHNPSDHVCFACDVSRLCTKAIRK